jgi:hypothetical protein
MRLWRTQVQVPFSLHENQPLTFIRRWFFILREVLREVLREIFVISLQKNEHLILIFLQQLTPLGQGNIFLKLEW